MEPVKRCRRITNYLGRLVVAVILGVETDQELLRGRCRVNGVQSRWHEETCRKLCVRDPHNAACMNGCSYGSLTVTKLVCDKMESTEAVSASRCPDGVNCMEACRAYDDEKPTPDLRNSCVRGCSNIVPSACARSLQIYRDLVKGGLQ
ncbi:hypothetical protein PHMEG_00024495 [Phytophthora megakarya]|uniref:Uncharacterized protein n=1 Tax=Phytophthora megakarya TaxID=4795 RepID=A0A225VEB4_9STRA|nr:hypothetical protein PHMEG_00024495 [Phytophthora megakarya]